MLESVTDFAVHRFSDEPFSDSGKVRIWFADLDEQQTETAQLSWLSAREHVRAARLKNPLDRQRYIASRVITRRVLHNLTGTAPEKLEILTDKCGKPCLRMPAVAGSPSSQSLLRFNLSHSENIFCIATALGCDVGIDIEVVNPSLDVFAISQACLEQENINLVQSSSPKKRCLVFYRLWTRREAFAKMQGHGVASNHVHRMSVPPWSLRTLEFTLGGKQVVGTLAIAA